MSIKNGVLKMLARVEAVEIKPVVGYVLAAFMLIFGSYTSLSYFFKEISAVFTVHFGVCLAAVVLLALTKKTEYFGCRLARIFAIVFTVGAVMMAFGAFSLVCGACRNIMLEFITFLADAVLHLDFYEVSSAVYTLFLLSLGGFILLSCNCGYCVGEKLGKTVEKYMPAKGKINKSDKTEKPISEKSFIFRFVNKIENAKIKPTVGYSLAIFMLFLITILCSMVVSGLAFDILKRLNLNPDYGVLVFLLAPVILVVSLFLLALTKKARHFGVKTGRVFVVCFLLLLMLMLLASLVLVDVAIRMSYLSRPFITKSTMKAVRHFFVGNLFSNLILGGFFSYLLGEKLAKRVKISRT